MLIAIFGESCTGKTTFSMKLKEFLKAEVYSGKDYLRLAKNEEDAKHLFQERLKEAVFSKHVIYVITEREDLSILPDGAIRVLVTADLETIKERFALRMHGNLPLPIATMLERKHGCFDKESFDIHIQSMQTDLDDACHQIGQLIQNRTEPN